MNSPDPNSWQLLFAGGAAAGEQFEETLRVVNRAGRPFLLLPESPACAARALALYPAQTLKARAAKLFLGLALRTGMAPKFPTESVSVPLEDGFVRFLIESSGQRGVELPWFAILPGNPNTEGQRFVILLFDTNDQPVAVVKAGLSAPARRLVAHESNFLAALPPRLEGVPSQRGKFFSSRLDAFAFDFVSGRSPGINDFAPLGKILNSWISVGQLVTMSEVPAWRRLVDAPPGSLPPALQSLETMQFHATLWHGDCAPWNIKVDRGRWTLLDWERGELVGVPTWDWLHYVLQSSVLVRRETVAGLQARLEKLFGATGFQDYAARAGVSGKERALALAYLNYCVRVIRPSEGLDPLTKLEQAARASWLT
jgi:hypothetical protein